MRYLVAAQPIEQYKQKEKYCMPLGIAYVNGALRSAGFDVDGINMMFVEGDPYEVLFRKIQKEKYDVLLCGGLSAEYPILKRIFDIAKSAHPGIITIGGGGGFSASPILFSELTGVDYAVIGEGEITDVELARALEKHSDVRKVDGIVYKDGAGYHQTSPRASVYDLDHIPFPSYEGLAMEEYLDHQQVDGWYNYFTYYSDNPRMMPMLMSRSCPYMCSFCFHPIGRGYRSRGMDNFFEELDLWIEKYQINGIALVDECFSMDPGIVSEFCRRIKPYHIAWACQMRAEIYDRELMWEMKEAGCIGACFGIESMSPTVLDNMQKHLNQETIEKALRISYECGVGASGNLIFGAETENFDTIWDSLVWNRKHVSLCRHQPINTFTYIQTYPGSLYYTHAVETGRIQDEKEYIKKGQWNLNITELSDRDYRKIGEVSRLLQHETRDRGELLSLKEQTDGRLTVTFVCPHCGSIQTYHNMSRRHLKKHRIRNLGCRNCNGMGDYLIDEKFFPYDRFHVVDWLLGRRNSGIFSADIVNIIKNVTDKRPIRIGILGAGYLADMLLEIIHNVCDSEICTEWVLQRKQVNELTIPVTVIKEASEMTKVEVVINTELIHPDWALKNSFPGAVQIDMEEIIRRVERKTEKAAGNPFGCLNQDLILVDEQDNETGYGEKMAVHRKGLLHRAFSVFIFDWKTRRMLLQRRAFGKYHSGGLWSNACCSHPRANEKMERCLSDRLWDELGLRVNLRIVDPDERRASPGAGNVIYFCGKFTYHVRFGEISEDEIDHVFLYCPPDDPFGNSEPAFDPEEVEELKWVPMEELEAWMEQKPEDFSAWFRPAFKLVRRAFHGML